MRKRLIISIVAIGLATSVVCIFGIDSGDVESVEFVQAGIDNLHSSIVSGTGKITEHIWMRLNDKATFETESACEVAFSGDRVRISKRETYLRNDPPSDMHPDDAANLIKVGTAYSTEYCLSSQSATVFEPAEKKARRGEPGSRAYTEAKSLFHQLVKAGLGLRSGTWKSDDRITRVGPQLVGRENVGGDECFVLEYKAIPRVGNREKALITRYWINPNKSFAVQCLRTWSNNEASNQKLLLTGVDIDLRQYGEIWQPSSVAISEYRKDKSSGEQVLDTKITLVFDPNFRFNVPVPESALKMKLPSSTVIYDEVLKDCRLYN